VRRLLVLLLILGLLLVVVDRVAVLYTQRQVANGIQQAQNLPERPFVRVSSIPFLTQALAGRYETVELRGRGFVGEDGTRVERLEATLRGARVPLSDLRAGTLDEVPVERVEGEALITWADLEDRIGRDELSLSAAGEAIRVVGELEVLGSEVSVSADSTVEVQGEDLRVTARNLSVGDDVADNVLNALVGGELDFRVSLEDLPYDLVLREIEVTEQGIVAVAEGRDTVLASQP
jgi:hypothetical protein